MEIFFIEFRDPIFGLVTLVSIILMIAVLSYAWGVFRSKDEKVEIEKFIKKFDQAEGLSKEHKDMLAKFDIDSVSLCLLAATFSKTGDFEKAINIYAIALNKAKNRNEKELVLTELGQVFFKAGFLERASSVFLESLKLSPRNPTALKFIVMIDEKLKKYGDALDALDALLELGFDTRAQTAYINILQILIDKEPDIDAKTAKILEFSPKFPLASRIALELWIKNGKELAALPKFPNLDDAIDLIYRQSVPVNLSDERYKALFYAKGLVKEECDVQGFELSVISNLRKSGFERAELSFNYVCKSCKNSFPIHFYRCPMCHELASVQILPHITEKSDENSMPF